MKNACQSSYDFSFSKAKIYIFFNATAENLAILGIFFLKSENLQFFAKPKKLRLFAERIKICGRKFAICGREKPRGQL